MFKFFKKENEEDTFKNRVDKFWIKFQTDEKKLTIALNQKDSATVSKIITELVKTLSINVSWSLKPGDKTNSTSSFSLSPEGNKHLALLTYFWQKNAPNTKGWKFYASKPENHSFGDMTFDIDGESLKLSETLFSYLLDDKTKKVDIEIFNPVFKKVTGIHLKNLPFLILDELLGEAAVETYIGKVSSSLTTDDKFVNYKKFCDFIKHIIEENEEKNENILINSWYSYTKDPDHTSKFRKDIFVGSTLVPDLSEKISNPLKGTGSGYIYVKFNNENIDRNNLITDRSKISKTIEDVLAEENLGYLVGEATGLSNSYLDFILFDIEKGVQIIKEKLQSIENHTFYIEKFFS